MDAITLNPGDYRGTYKLVGGRLSLDLINTVSWPATTRVHDWLDSPDNLQRWLRAVGLPAIRARAADLQAAVELRAELAAVLHPLAHDEQPARKAIEVLNRRIEFASQRRIIDAATLAWKWKPAEQAIDAFAPVVMDAAELIAAQSHERLRHCPACDWLFEDQTRNGQRRWCDMADCGSRDKSRRYYRRARE
ncbi:MAG TPA: ABATE domain-containing protein [Steroidobacteraceae bacterium]|jgi:predicted RNA-binding Zn ribbon-like protein